MKYFLRVLCHLQVLLFFLFYSYGTNAQCLPGYTTDTLNWDFRDFLPNTGNPYTSYISLAQSQTQYFTFGTQKVTVTHTYSGNNDPGDDGIHTGSAGSYGNGYDVHFKGNGTITFTFDSPVLAAKFSVYDIDRYQHVTVTALNGILPVAVNMAKVSGSILTIAGSGTFSASAIASNGRASNSSSDGTANIDIALPVTSITLTVTNTGTANNEDGSFWISDLIACSAGAFPLNYYAVSQPFTNQPGYFLVALDNSVYYVDIASGNAKFLFTDAGCTNINSLAYDPYRHMVYYTYSLTGSASTDKIVRRYDYEQDTLGILTNDINSLGVPTYDAGVESGAAAFFDGALYIGIEGYASSGANSNRESAIWRIELDSSYSPTGNAAQVYAVPGDNGSGTLLHDWSDFGINDGILYDFDGAASNRDFYHNRMLTGGTVNFVPSPPGLVPRQVSVDWTGQVYNVGSPSASASGTIVPYNYDGTVNTALQFDITYNGSAISGSWGDAAEAFKPKTDFGDAPASYDAGPGDPATHEVIDNLRLGDGVDIEFAKKTSVDASGDNYDDGMSGLLVIPNGVVNYLRQVQVYNNTGADATVIGWLDANGDGVFQPGEGRAVTVPTGAAMQTADLFWAFINVTPPVGTTIFMRIRVTSAAYGMTTSDPRGFYETGEVEDYGIIVASILPEENILLLAKKENNNTAFVKWQPQNELTFKEYELQRSADGTNWQTIYKIEVNEFNYANYAFTDISPLQPESYYRVKVEKIAGGILYSDIKRLIFTGHISLSVAPNPAKSRARLNIFSQQEGEAAIRLINLAGKVVYRSNLGIKPGKNEIRLPVISSLSPGVYKVSVVSNRQHISTTLVVVH